MYMSELVLDWSGRWRWTHNSCRELAHFVLATGAGKMLLCVVLPLLCCQVSSRQFIPLDGNKLRNMSWVYVKCYSLKTCINKYVLDGKHLRMSWNLFIDLLEGNVLQVNEEYK